MVTIISWVLHCAENPDVGSEPTKRFVLMRTPEADGKEKEVYIELNYATGQYKIAAKVRAWAGVSSCVENRLTLLLRILPRRCSRRPKREVRRAAGCPFGLTDALLQ